MGCGMAAAPQRSEGISAGRRTGIPLPKELLLNAPNNKFY